MSSRTKSKSASKKKKSPWIAHLERCVKEFKPFMKKKYTIKHASNHKQCRNIFYNMKKEDGLPYMFPSDEKKMLLKLNSSKSSSKIASRAGLKSKRRRRRRTCKKVSCKRRNRS
jgi:hypothetical protein|tara:strand:+ start:8577 stop:8918 length:342 start_codon:yes stop_codon:yes gene_type:complete